MTLVINAIFDLIGWTARTLFRLIRWVIRVALPGQSSAVRVLVTWLIILLVVVKAWTAVRHGHG